MANRKHIELGFGTVEVLIVIAVVVLLSGAGWFVFQHNRAKLTNAAPSHAQQTQAPINSSTNKQPTAQSTTSVVNVPELGIQITVPNDIKDLTYTANSGALNDGRQKTYAMFSTKALTALDAKCDDSFGPLGMLAKIDGQYPTSFSDSNPPIEYGSLVKQFPDFFISASSPQAGCDPGNSNALQAASKFKDEFQAAFPTIQQLGS